MQYNRNFWKDEHCEYCNSAITETVVDLHRKVNSAYVLIENVPIGVCNECGYRYYVGSILKEIENTVNDSTQAVREITVPVYSFHKSKAGAML